MIYLIYMETYVCKRCGVSKTMDNYYRKQRQCNECMKAKRNKGYVKKGRPADKLTEEIKHQMAEDIKTMKMVAMAKKYGVSPPTIKAWLVKGIIAAWLMLRRNITSRVMEMKHLFFFESNRRVDSASIQKSSHVKEKLYI